MGSLKKTEDHVSESEKSERSQGGLIKQLSCAFVVNLVSLLQGASVSSSSIILHELENNTEHIQAWKYILLKYASYFPPSLTKFAFRITTVTGARTAPPPTMSSLDPSPSSMTSTSHRRREAGLVSIKNDGFKESLKIV